MLSKSTETTTMEIHLVFGTTEKSKSHTANNETSKIATSNQLFIKVNLNLVKEVDKVNLTKIKKQMENQIKILIMEDKVTQATSDNVKVKTILKIISFNRTLQNMKESHLIQNQPVLWLVLL